MTFKQVEETVIEVEPVMWESDDYGRYDVGGKKYYHLEKILYFEQV